MQKKRISLLMLFLVMTLVMAACAAPMAAPGAADTSSDGAAAVASDPVTLDINLGTEPPSLDPSLGTDTTSISVINETFLGLTELDPDTQKAGPELAKDWSISDDGLTYTFNLRTDVPWVQVKDGEVVETGMMVTAGDVAYGLKRTCNAETASDYAYVLYIVAGCEAANTGEGSVDDVAVNAVDDATLEITLNYPASFFEQIASMWIMRPMPQSVIEEYGDAWTEPENIVTNGPFALSEWIHGDSLQMIRNPFWYGWEEMGDVVGNIEVINGVMIEEVSTAFALYENNEIDTSGVPLEMMDLALAGEYGDEFVIAPSNCTYYYGFITQKPEVSDPRVRRALSMAVDRQTLADDILKGGQIPANTFTNPLNFGSPAGDPDIAPWAMTEAQGGTGYAAAVEMAKALMEEAGYPGGAGLSLTLAHNVSESHATIAQAIQAMWQEAFPDIEVVIETQEWGVYLDSLDHDAPLEGKPDVYRLGWCQDYPHANNWIHEVFNPTQGANVPMLSMDDPIVGDLVKQFNDDTIAAQTASEDEQLALYKDAEKLFVDDIAAIIPIYYYTTVAVTKPWVTRLYSDDKYYYRWSVDEAAKEAAR
ncbi:MAG: peptide ABC transporter substrate-binding protein [Caldilineaceae bacterium]|nr:peptide ABC transporter substrate-binding protein [Caldilineaceae bacterium]